MSLFEGAISQYIDANGKTRMLNYRHNGRTVSLMTSPLPPFDLPSPATIKEAPIDIVSDFMKTKGLEVVRQDKVKDTEDTIKGVWVTLEEQSPPIYYGYIPVQSSQAIPNVDFADENTRDPLRVNGVSELEEYRHNRKTADYLKNYTLYAYSLDPDNFGEDSFEVIPDYTYDLEAINKRLNDNPIMFTNDGRLKVPSEEVKRKLLSYLKVQLATDAPTVMNYKNRTNIDDYYQSIYDFRTSNSQLVFINKESLMRWKQETIRQTSVNVVGHRLVEDAVEPYYYRNSNVRRNRLAIVQNVEGGELKLALSVAGKWVSEQINLGYRANGIETDPSTVQYTVYSENDRAETHNKNKPLGGSVIQYPSGGYGALLFI